MSVMKEKNSSVSFEVRACGGAGQERRQQDQRGRDRHA